MALANPDPADPAVAVAHLRDLTRIITAPAGGMTSLDIATDRYERMTGALLTVDAWLGTIAAGARRALNRLETTRDGDDGDAESDAAVDVADLLAQLLAGLGHPATGAPPGGTRRVVDVSDVDGVLAGFWIDEGGEDDSAELVCKECTTRSKDRRLGPVCDVGDADMDTLVRACLDHVHEEPDETAWTAEERRIWNA
jgi:hypothetical protein